MDTIPQISISLAPPEDLPIEPYSPFNNVSFNLPDHDDGFRAIHLTPPPVHTRFRNLQSPTESKKVTGRGLDRERFEALLNSSKDKPAAKKPAMDLRKEVALKAHKHKQAERRALFLSRVLQPPSPTATVTPATPPDSPAIFHYSLPSPGLVSPITHYESLHDDDSNNGISCRPWVEQVDFKLLAPNKTTRLSLNNRRQPLPSLEQISARLNFHRNLRAQESLDIHDEPLPLPPTPEKHEQLVVGRLKMPVRSTPKPLTITVTSDEPPSHFAKPAAPQPIKPANLTVEHVGAVSPTELSRINLLGLNSRESRSSTMLNTLRRRTQSTTKYSAPQFLSEDARKGFRRHSAPPDSLRERSGFEHPILALPGAF